MITVRFPTGFSVQYNGAGYIEGPDEKGTVRLRKEKGDSNLIARIPSDCIIEMTPPCRAYMAQGDDPAAANRTLQHKLDLARKQIAKLKKGQPK